LATALSPRDFIIIPLVVKPLQSEQGFLGVACAISITSSFFAPYEELQILGRIFRLAQAFTGQAATLPGWRMSLSSIPRVKDKSAPADSDLRKQQFQWATNFLVTV
jgi:hypothetical protein